MNKMARLRAMLLAALLFYCAESGRRFGSSIADIPNYVSPFRRGARLRMHG